MKNERDSLKAELEMLKKQAGQSHEASKETLNLLLKDVNTINSAIYKGFSLSEMCDSASLEAFNSSTKLLVP